MHPAHPHPGTTPGTTLVTDRPVPEAGRADGAVGTGGRRAVPGSVLTALAFGVVALPFVVALARLWAQPGARLFIPDDIALIDLHTRQAIAWRQQLGVFDRNGWSHPGPAYFYVLGVVDRVFGTDERSLFIGATVVNGAAAAGCVAVVRRLATPTRALWAAVVVGVLAFALAATGPSATTYSETVLGGLVSPWNPLVVVLPLLLLLLLAGAAMTGSALAAAGALVVGSFVVQTDLSTLPLVAPTVAVAEVTWVVRALGRRGGRWPASALGDGRRRRGGPWTVAGAWALVALFVLMWVPPVVEQLTNHPGNMTLVYRYFTSGRAGHGVSTALGGVAAATAVFVVGPSEVMTKALEGSQPHQVLAALTLVATVALAAAAALLGRRRTAFGAALGALVLVGCLAAVVGVTHLVGHVYGYLVLWAVVLPAAALIAAGVVGPPASWTVRLRRAGGPGAVRVGLAALAVVFSLAAVARVAAMPSLEQASDPQVARLAALVAPHLRRGQPVAVSDARAGRSPDGVLIDIERFLGLVDVLDREGYVPQVNRFWLVEVGPGHRDDGTAPHNVVLSTWTPSSPASPGYVGRVGDMAVEIVGRGVLVLPPG